MIILVIIYFREKEFTYRLYILNRLNSEIYIF